MQATVSGPSGEATSATTATRGSSATRLRRPLAAEPVRRAARQGGQPQHPPAGHRIAREQGHAVRRGAGSSPPVAAVQVSPGVPVRAGTNRWSTAAIASAATAVRSVWPRAGLAAVDLLQGEDVGVQLAYDVGEPVRVHPVVSRRAAAEDVEGGEAHRGGGQAAAGVPRIAARAPSAPGTGLNQAHRPRFSRCSTPASTSTLRWWLTVGWLSPIGAVRSQTQASPLASTIDSSRSRAGSASALSRPASSSASDSDSGSAVERRAAQLAGLLEQRQQRTGWRWACG